LNRPPLITSRRCEPGSGCRTAYDADATDPENQAVTFALLSAPVGMSIDTDTGLVEWTPTALQTGTFRVSIGAQDPLGAFGEQTFLIHVVANSQPTITSTPGTAATTGDTYRYDVVATDPDGDSLTYELTSSPPGMSINDRGRITWNTAGVFGTASVGVRVQDGRGGIATQTFNVNVTADQTAPQAAAILTPNPAPLGSEVTIQVMATDNVGVQSVTLTVNGTPLPTDGNGVARYQAVAVGDFPIQVLAADGAGNQDLQHEPRHHR
jgi:hypothetical protein